MGSHTFDVTGWTESKKDGIYTSEDLHWAFTFYTADVENIEEKPDGMCVVGVVKKTQSNEIMAAWHKSRGRDKSAIDSLAIDGIDKWCLKTCMENGGPTCALVINDDVRKKGQYPPIDSPVRVDFFGSYHS